MSGLDLDPRVSACCRGDTTVSADWPDAGSPLHGLKVAPHAALQEAQQRGRLKCSTCGGSRMFFCYTCCSLVGLRPQEVPLVKLPVKIDIIKHPNETDGKSTAIHAKILAPGDVTIYPYPCIPPLDKGKVVLVFPGPEAVSVQDVLQCLLDRSHDSSSEPPPKRLKTEEPGRGPSDGAQGWGQGACPLQRVVFIDSTWNQTNKISTDERLQGLLQVELKSRTTCFWRRQKGKPDSYLATIEAIYYFLKDFHQLGLLQPYGGEYDNLLFFYTFLHSVVNKAKRLAGKT